MKFSERIIDRHRRWWIDRAEVPLKCIANKMQGRVYASNFGVEAPRLLFKSNDANCLPSWDELPPSFVIKPVRGSGNRGVYPIHDGVNVFDGLPAHREKVIADLSRFNNNTFIIEEFLLDEFERRGAPLDYKFYCFGSAVAFLHIIERNSSTDARLNRHWFVTDGWSKLNIRIQKTQKPEENTPRMPRSFPEMLRQVRTMGDAIGMFMRIDMYATGRGPVFGEFTPQPHGGRGYTDEADEWLGGLWRGVEGCGD